MSGKFRVHGNFNCYIDGQVLVTEVTGPWNKELVEAWAEFTYPIALAASSRGAYVGIAQIHRSMLCPPDALEALRQKVRYASKHLNCICNVVVAGHEVEGRDFVEPNFVQIYENVVPYRFFYELDEALAWSHELLQDLNH
jgi:hypothetical protein